jgi:Carboxypeptidase regulatory-like domain
MHSSLSKSVLVFVVVIGMTSLGVAQRTTATFAGIVTDPTSAVLPGATVQLINEGTSAVTEKITGETGEFLFDYVPVGTYTLKISLPGFRTYESRAIPLGAAQTYAEPIRWRLARLRTTSLSRGKPHSSTHFLPSNEWVWTLSK